MRALQLRSDAITGGVLVVRAGDETLRMTGPGEQRHELIAAVRGGKHHELAIDAITFRQGTQPNRKFLRFNPSALAAIAASYVGMPVLRDHSTHALAARIGTIAASTLVHDNGIAAFKQTLKVVKPEAVIGVLDGTLDRFSIGWAGTGPVLCTVHKLDVRSRASSCGCWPGDKVLVDGVQHTVEYEFQSAEGTEVSAVNVPAVRGTRVQDVRAALAAERDRGLLVLPDRRRIGGSKSAPPTPRRQARQPDPLERELAHVADVMGLPLADLLETYNHNRGDRR